MAEENKTALSAAQVDKELETLAGWTRSEAVLARHFVFHTFEEITAFLTHLVRAITTQNHHPDFSLNTGLKMVSVALTTHSEQAITRADIEFARALNAWARALSGGRLQSPGLGCSSVRRDAQAQTQEGERETQSGKPSSEQWRSPNWAGTPALSKGKSGFNTVHHKEISYACAYTGGIGRHRARNEQGGPAARRP